MGVSAALVFFVSYASADDRFIKIEAPFEYDLVVDGEPKHISPRCALSEYTQEPYSFYVKKGKKNRIVIFFNGGGACWNDPTCQPDSTIYVPSNSAKNNPNQMDGLFNVDNEANPYKDWTMVFLPYCTGDIFLSSQEKTYINTRPTPEFPYTSFTLNHHGYDDFLYVMDYIKKNLVSRWFPLRKVMVAGSSAGAYGATLNFPRIREMLPVRWFTRVFLINDGGNGVITDEILDDAFFGETSSWKIDANLHPNLQHLVNEQVGTDLMSNAFKSLISHYPRDRFAQYTAAYDVVQTLFINIMLYQDNPELWFGFDYDFFEWNDAVDSITGELSDASSKHRRYIEAGCDHTILRFPEFYESAFPNEGISFLQWMSSMTREKGAERGDWINLSCTLSPDGDCGEDHLTPEGTNACLERITSLP